MFFRPTRTGGDKRKRSKAGGQGARPTGNPRNTGGKPAKAGKADKADKADKAGKANKTDKARQAGGSQRRSRRLDSAVPLLPAAIPRAPARLPERGAPLSDATQWLLERMRRLKNLDEYAALKQPFIERYSRDPRHSPASAERAFYQAVGVCIRRILEERAQRR